MNHAADAAHLRIVGAPSAAHERGKDWNARRSVGEEDVYVCPADEKLAYHYTNEENGLVLRRYWTNAQSCATKQRCTTGKERRITRWEHEHVLEEVPKRLDKNPQAMRQRPETAEHPFATLKMRMGATHFLMSAQGRHRDGAARTRLQSYPRHEHRGHSAADGRHPGIVKSQTRLASPARAVLTSSGKTFLHDQNLRLRR